MIRAAVLGFAFGIAGSHRRVACGVYSSCDKCLMPSHASSTMGADGMLCDERSGMQ